MVTKRGSGLKKRFIVLLGCSFTSLHWFYTQALLERRTPVSDEIMWERVFFGVVLPPLIAAFDPPWPGTTEPSPAPPCSTTYSTVCGAQRTTHKHTLGPTTLLRDRVYPKPSFVTLCLLNPPS